LKVAGMRSIGVHGNRRQGLGVRRRRRRRHRTKWIKEETIPHN